MEDYICPTCGNKDKNSIGYINGKPYCRKCLSFRGEEIKEYESYPKRSYLSLNYELSDEQKVLSDKLVDNYKNSINTLVYAVCGSGKTEIVLKVIKYAIQCGENVGFAIPRRDVVIELYDRIKNIFKRNTVTCVYGGNTSKLNGDIVVLTTHQLFRYPKYFDLLIVDEIDAFPFNNNDVLYSFFETSIRKNYILMSATPSKKIINSFQKKGFDTLTLFSRFHNHPLPVPILICKPKLILFIKMITVLNKFIKQNKQTFIFAPTIELCEEIFSFLSLIFKQGNCVHSKKIDRANIIEDFKIGKYKYLVTTAVLERGVTVKDLQVIVFLANHHVYNSYTLTQIAGRVGRKKDAPNGYVYFLANEINEEIKESISQIKSANKNLQNLF